MAGTPDVEDWKRHGVVHLDPEEWVTDVQQTDDEESTDDEDGTVGAGG